MSIRRRLTALSLCLLLAGCGGEIGPGVGVGKKAPEITGEAMNGTPITLSQFEGKVVLIDFWATWCGPCREDIPHGKDLYQHYQGRPFAILGISSDYTRDALKNFLDRDPLPWPNIFDGSNNITRQWNVEAFPTYVLVDHKGIIVGRWVGGGNSSRIDKAVERAMKEAEKK